MPEFNTTKPPNYRRGIKSCPDDSHYSYTNYNSNCFTNDWFAISGNHSGGGGNMMLVTLRKMAEVFSCLFTDLKPNTYYQFVACLTNGCCINGGCNPLPANIKVGLRKIAGQKAAEFIAGLSNTEVLSW